MTSLIVFTSRMLKIIDFNNSKLYFIYFITPFYDIPNIKSFIFLTTSLKYYFFILFYLFFILNLISSSLFHCVCLFSQTKRPNPLSLFSNSKLYFIYFNIPFYNIPNIKSFIFFTTSLKYYFFILF